MQPPGAMTQLAQYDGLEGTQKNKVYVAVRFRPLRLVWRPPPATRRLPIAGEACSFSLGPPPHAAAKLGVAGCLPGVHSSCRSDRERARGDHEAWECNGNAVGIVDDLGMRVSKQCWLPKSHCQLRFSRKQQHLPGLHASIAQAASSTVST